MDNLYCIDTSSIGELNDRYPKKRFRNLWEDIDDLIAENRLFSCKDVFKELERKTGKHNHLVHQWRKYKHIFYDLGENEFEVIREIVDEFPNALPITSKDGVHADIPLVAMAKARNAIIITQENARKQYNIPVLCHKKGIQSLNILGLMEKENWEY